MDHQTHHLHTSLITGLGLPVGISALLVDGGFDVSLYFVVSFILVIEFVVFVFAKISVTLKRKN